MSNQACEGWRRKSEAVGPDPTALSKILNLLLPNSHKPCPKSQPSHRNNWEANNLFRKRFYSSNNFTARNLYNLYNLVDVLIIVGTRSYTLDRTIHLFDFQN